MKYFISLLLVLVLLPEAYSQEIERATTFILLRHAEKADDGTKDPDLSSEGHARANRIASMLCDTPVEAIYATAYKRTQNTVRPLAEKLSISVKAYEPLKKEAIEQMLADHRGGTIVVAGHSNTVPRIANLLIGAQRFSDFADDEYGIMLIVSVTEMGKVVNVVRVNY